MADFTPSFPYNVPAYLLIPVSKSVKGVTINEYPLNGEVIYCSFKTYGGTETESNGVITVLDTANIETWYRPDIKANCHIKLAESGKEYAIIGTPENINMRNQFVKFKVQAVSGGA